MAFGIFDAHCDTLIKISESDNLYDADRSFNLKYAGKYGYFIQVMAIWLDIEKDADNIDSRISQYTDLFYRELSKNQHVNHIKTKDDLIKATEGINLILGIEGGEAIGNDINNIAKLYEKGVRIITLTWNFPNLISEPNQYAGGLTDFGRDVVKEMNRLGIVVDVSHLSDRGFYDVAELSAKPFIASHSNSRAICNNARNITDDMFKILIKKGGVTGINLFYAFLNDEKSHADMNDIIRHIEHFMSLGGEKNVGIGSDFDGIAYPPDCCKNTAALGNIYEALLKLNYNEDVVRDIMSRNMERVFRENL